MKKSLTIAFVAFLLVQCNKDVDFNDLSGPASLKGVAVVYDTLFGTVNLIPAKNLKVYLKYATDNNGYLYSSSTNSAAQYFFNGIDIGNSYSIYASVDTGIVKYDGKLDYSANGFQDRQSDSLKLYPSEKSQNGIHLMVRDTLGGSVANVTAWVFNSPVLFGSDSSAGKIFDMTSNKFGVNNVFNLAPGTYYLRIKTRIGNVDLVGESTVTITNTGIKNCLIVLTRPITIRNGIELITNDVFGNPVNNSKTYFYRSRAVYQSDTTSIIYPNSLFNLTSNASGFASSSPLDTGMYYFRSVRVVASDTLRSNDSIRVFVNEISKKTITLRK